MKIKIEMQDGMDPVVVDVGGQKVSCDKVYCGIGIETERGIFGIAERDGVIEVMHNGKLILDSDDISTLIDDGAYKTDELSFARQVAARAWCGKTTSGKEMDVDLAEEFAKILYDYMEALQWCGGSADFCDNGKARGGWMRIVEPLLRS